MNLINRTNLEHTARTKLGYSLQDAEKDYFLTLVLKLINESSLSKDLIFKGGTAIYHCYLDQLRFSEDLDFTSINKSITLDRIKQIFTPYDIFEIKKEFVSEATLKIERLKYSGILETPNSLKVEVDKLQNIYLPPQRRKYKNFWDIEFSVLVMDQLEICAEKVRACNERFRYRDFYDLYMLINTLNISTKKVFDLLKHKEVRKPISQATVEKHLEYSLEEVSAKADTVAYKKTLPSNKLTAFIKSLDVPNIEATNQSTTKPLDNL